MLRIFPKPYLATPFAALALGAAYVADARAGSYEVIVGKNQLIQTATNSIISHMQKPDQVFAPVIAKELKDAKACFLPDAGNVTGAYVGTSEKAVSDLRITVEFAQSLPGFSGWDTSKAPFKLEPLCLMDKTIIDQSSKKAIGGDYHRSTEYSRISPESTPIAMAKYAMVDTIFHEHTHHKQQSANGYYYSADGGNQIAHMLMEETDAPLLTAFSQISKLLESGLSQADIDGLNKNLNDYPAGNFLKRLVALYGHSDGNEAFKLDLLPQSVRNLLYPVFMDYLSGIDAYQSRARNILVSHKNNKFTLTDADIQKYLSYDGKFYGDLQGIADVLSQMTLMKFKSAREFDIFFRNSQNLWDNKSPGRAVAIFVDLISDLAKQEPALQLVKMPRCEINFHANITAYLKFDGKNPVFKAPFVRRAIADVVSTALSHINDKFDGVLKEQRIAMIGYLVQSVLSEKPIKPPASRKTTGFKYCPEGGGGG